ncbi:MAG: hypothetical protein GX483_03715 [Actinomycetaceae bacterium]|nr:hypothetical protein [Actinomycetaceae bacterium]
MTDLIRYLGIPATGALAVFIAAVVMYLFFSTILYLWGTRIKSSNSPLTVAVATLGGAIAARSILGDTPTLAGGLIALSTLLLMERLFGRLRAAMRRRRKALDRGSD